MSPLPRALTIGEQLKRAVEHSGLSAGEVARLSGVDRRQVARFLAGQRDLTLATAGRIAEALGLRLAESPGTRRRTPPR